MLGDVMVDSGAFVPCCPEDAFPHQSGAVELARSVYSSGQSSPCCLLRDDSLERAQQ